MRRKKSNIQVDKMSVIDFNKLSTYEISKTNIRILLLIITAGLSLGLIHLLGFLPVAGITIFLLGCVIILLFNKCYHFLMLTGIVLLSCVFFEPSPSDLILAALIPLGLITGVYKPQIQGKALTASLILLFYFIVSLTGVILSTDQILSLRYYLITFYLFLISLLICTYARQVTIASLQRAYIFAAFISILAGLAGYLGLFSELLMADSFRVKGFFKDPNVFGPFFIPAIIILVDDIKHKSILKTHTIVHASLILMFTIGVIFSFSRAAWINLFVVLLTYFLLNLKALQTIQIIKIFLAVILLLSLIFCLLFSPIMDGTGVIDFLQERAQLQHYDNYRFNAQQGGLELIIQNPFGYGPGQFVNEIVQITDNKIDAHSLYIRTAVENGVLGFILFFTGIAYILIILFINRKNIYSLSPIVIIAIICGLLVNSLVVDTIHWRHFWLFIGFGLFILNEVPKEVNEK